MSSLLQDLHYGLRALRRSPGFTAVAVLSLALGIGATSALFSVVHGVILRPLPFEQPDRLVRVYETDRAGTELGSVSPPNFMSLGEQSVVLSGIALYGGIRPTLTGVGEPREIEAVEVSAGFFGVLGVQPTLGRFFLEGENRAGEDRVVILGHGLWQRLFDGDPEVLGRTLALDGVPRTVVGVVPAGLEFPGERELWVPIRYDERYSADHADNRRSRWHAAIARLRPGVTRDDAEARLRDVAQRLERAFPEENANVRFATVPLRDEVVGEARTPLLLLFGAVALVLLIACANVAGLLLGRAVTRQGELAVRAALGAGRGRLLRQLLSESVLLATIGGVAGLLMAWWAVETLVTARPDGLPRPDEIRLDGTVLAFTFAVTLLTGVLAGIAPALRATSGSLSRVLRAGGRGGPGSRASTRTRAGLVVAEFALAVILLVGAGLLLRSFVNLVSVETGLWTEQVLTFPVRPGESQGSGERIRTYYAGLLDRVSAVPGVESAAAVSRLPIGQSTFTYRVDIEGLPPAAPGEEREIRTRVVTPDYFRVMGIPLHQGRHLSEFDQGELPVTVLNQAAARHYFRGEDPIGKRVRAVVNERVGGEVVGVVADARQNALHEDPHPEMYIPHAQFPRAYMTVVVRTAGDPLALIAAIRSELHAFDPGLALPDFRTLDQVVTDSVSRPRFLALLLGLFAGVAVALAAIGIFGLLSFTVAQQTREIGIRMALGSEQRGVVGLVVRRGLLLTTFGLGIGTLGAAALTRLLGSLLFGVSPADPVTFVAVILLLMATALLASFLPARRAAAVDPMVALRAE